MKKLHNALEEKIKKAERLPKSTPTDLSNIYTKDEIDQKILEIPIGGVEEAPIDTKQYGRQDAAWTEVVAGGAPEGTAVKSTGETGGAKFLREDGDGTCSWQTPAGGGHTQNTDTGTTGNTFTVDSDSVIGKIIVDVALGAADLSLTLTNEALTASSKVATLQNKTGTLALTSDIPVKATGTEVDTGTDDVKFVTPKAMEDSSYVKLGETSATAYRGDRGKTAYDHSQETHAPAAADNTTQALNGASMQAPTAETKIITLEGEVVSQFSYADLLKDLDARYSPL